MSLPRTAAGASGEDLAAGAGSGRLPLMPVPTPTRATAAAEGAVGRIVIIPLP